MSWLRPFSPKAPIFPNREEHLKRSRQRAGKRSAAILKRRAIYRKQGIESGPVGRPKRLRRTQGPRIEPEAYPKS